MIIAQPGKRDIAQRHDGQWNVYRFSPELDSAMQWETVAVARSRSEAIAIAFPKRAQAA